MKIISWNVNSIRVRLNLIIDILETEKPDIICLQETKVNDSQFPEAIFNERNYFSYFKGISSYNGVAILSKNEAQRYNVIDICQKDDARYLELYLDDLQIISVYVPAGGEEPNPSTNQKFNHKLNFLSELDKILKKKKKEKVILCGDLNVAPYEDDVWSHKSLRNVVSHTEVERTRLNEILNNCNFIDSLRHFINPPDNVFTWWSYRSPNFEKNNRGRRLDHIWASSSLIGNLKNAKIIQEYRKKVRPSDHAPVCLELNLD
ncbi:MAG: exodeoxyribonuclease III [Alphaproteobacteria bacterium]|tara:strand:- start:490 stop:1272 length:783 start_codon:yes stop_codon:yes gene_type:complete